MTTYIITWRDSQGITQQWETPILRAADTFMQALIARGLHPFIAVVPARRAA